MCDRCRELEEKVKELEIDQRSRKEEDIKFCEVLTKMIDKIMQEK